MHSTAKGDLTEAMVTAALLRLGHALLRPISANSGYDLVIDRSGKFERIQCKTGRLRNGAVVFNTHSLAGGKYKRTYHGRADTFGVYCPETRLCYMVPVEKTGVRYTALRIEPSKNNQKVGINLASDFVISL